MHWKCQCIHIYSYIYIPWVSWNLFFFAFTLGSLYFCVFLKKMFFWKKKGSARLKACHPILVEQMDCDTMLVWWIFGCSPWLEMTISSQWAMNSASCWNHLIGIITQCQILIMHNIINQNDNSNNNDNKHDGSRELIREHGNSGHC